MPRITALNLHKGDDLTEIEAGLKAALVSIPEMEINDYEVDLVPLFAPDGFHASVARIDVDLWEAKHRTKDQFQELASRMAAAFLKIVGSERKVKVVIKPYDISQSGWVSF
jgi:hypothetical protein